MSLASRSLVGPSLGSLVALALALAGPALAGPSAATPRRPGAHPATGADPAVQDCAECHEAATPAVVKAWEASRHGEAMVKCLVCHGDTGQAFVRRPGAPRCAACHAVQVASLATRKGQAAGCFSCHDPHALSPAPGRASPHRR
jgi:hypothetical protein